MVCGIDGVQRLYTPATHRHQCVVQHHAFSQHGRGEREREACIYVIYVEGGEECPSAAERLANVTPPSTRSFGASKRSLVAIVKAST